MARKQRPRRGVPKIQSRSLTSRASEPPPSAAATPGVARGGAAPRARGRDGGATGHRGGGRSGRAGAARGAGARPGAGRPSSARSTVAETTPASQTDARRGGSGARRRRAGPRGKAVSRNARKRAATRRATRTAVRRPRHCPATRRRGMSADDARPLSREREEAGVGVAAAASPPARGTGLGEAGTGRRVPFDAAFPRGVRNCGSCFRPVSEPSARSASRASPAGGRGEGGARRVASRAPPRWGAHAEARRDAMA